MEQQLKLRERRKQNMPRGMTAAEKEEALLAENLLNHAIAMHAQGRLSTDKLDAADRRATEMIMKNADPEHYQQARRNDAMFEDLMRKTEDPDGRNAHETRKYRDEVWAEIAGDMLQIGNDMGIVDDVEFTRLSSIHKTLPPELLDVNGQPAAPAEHIAAEMEALRTAKALGIPDVRPGSLVVNDAKPVRPLDVDAKVAAEWKANADHGRARLRNDLVKDHAEYAKDAQQQAKAMADVVKAERAQAEAEVVNTSPADTLGKILDAATK
jgi:hypothetical protein